MTSDADHREQATDQTAQALAKVTGEPVSQASTTVQDSETRYQRLATKAKQQATAVASTVATSALRGALAASRARF